MNSNFNQTPFDQILDDCLARLAAGETIAACLTRYPDHAAELRPLLQTAAAMHHTPAPHIDSEARAAGLQQMLDNLPAETTQTTRSGLFATLNHYADQLEKYFVKPLLTVSTTIAVILVAAFWLSSLREQVTQPMVEPQIEVTAVVDEALDADTSSPSNIIGGLRFTHPDTQEPFYWLLPNLNKKFYINQNSGPMEFDLLINPAGLSQNLTTFVHLFDENGTLISQTDRPFDSAAADTVWLTESLVNRQLTEADTAAAIAFFTQPQQISIPQQQGTYRLEAGLYNTATGQRLTYTNGDNTIQILEVDVLSEGAQQVMEPGRTPAVHSGPTDPQASLELGALVHNLGAADLNRQKMFTWVHHNIHWTPETTTATAADYIGEAHAAGFNVLVTIESYEEFPDSIDFAALQSFIGEVAALGPEAIELWPHANAQAWPLGQISPDDYVNKILAPAYQTIKTADPSIQVISGAPDQSGRFADCTHAGCNDDAFLEAIFAAGAADSLDCVGVHYIHGATAPSATSGHPADDGHHSWYYPTLVNSYSALTDKPLCFTRFGYVGRATREFDWAVHIEMGQRIEWLTEAIVAAQTDGRVPMLMLYTFGNPTYDPILELYNWRISFSRWCFVCEVIQQAFVTTTLADEQLTAATTLLPQQLTLLDGTICTRVPGSTLSFNGRRANYHCGEETDGQKQILIGDLLPTDKQPVQLLTPNADDPHTFNRMNTVGSTTGSLLEAVMVTTPDHLLNRCTRLSTELPDAIFDGRPALYTCEDGSLITAPPADQPVYEVTFALVIPSGNSFELPAASLRHHYAIAP